MAENKLIKFEPKWRELCVKLIREDVKETFPPLHSVSFERHQQPGGPDDFVKKSPKMYVDPNSFLVKINT
jgi:hypothetical protein